MELFSSSLAAAQTTLSKVLHGCRAPRIGAGAVGACNVIEIEGLLFRGLGACRFLYETGTDNFW